MGIFNYIGLIIIVILMIPNLIAMKLQKESFKNKFDNKALEIFENVGRIGTFIMMIVNIPVVTLGFFMDNALLVYVIVNSVLTTLYLIFWIVCRKRYKILKAFALSIIPCTIFVFSGIMLLNIPLIAFSTIFAVCHVTISIKNI